MENVQKELMDIQSTIKLFYKNIMKLEKTLMRIEQQSMSSQKTKKRSKPSKTAPVVPLEALPSSKTENEAITEQNL